MKSDQEQEQRALSEARDDMSEAWSNYEKVSDKFNRTKQNLKEAEKAKEMEYNSADTTTRTNLTRKVTEEQDRLTTLGDAKKKTLERWMETKIFYEKLNSISITARENAQNATRKVESTTPASETRNPTIKEEPKVEAQNLFTNTMDTKVDSSDPRDVNDAAATSTKDDKLQNVIETFTKLFQQQQQFVANLTSSLGSGQKNPTKEEHLKMPTLPTFRITIGTAHRMDTPIEFAELVQMTLERDRVPKDRWAQAIAVLVPSESRYWVATQMNVDNFQAEFIKHFLSVSDHERLEDEYARITQGEKLNSEGKPQHFVEAIQQYCDRFMKLFHLLSKQENDPDVIKQFIRGLNHELKIPVKNNMAESKRHDGLGYTNIKDTIDMVIMTEGIYKTDHKRQIINHNSNSRSCKHCNQPYKQGEKHFCSNRQSSKNGIHRHNSESNNNTFSHHDGQANPTYIKGTHHNPNSPMKCRNCGSLTYVKATGCTKCKAGAPKQRTQVVQNIFKHPQQLETSGAEQQIEDLFTIQNINKMDDEGINPTHEFKKQRATESLIVVDVRMNGKEATCLLDNGANLSAVSLAWMVRNNLKFTPTSGQLLLGAAVNIQRIGTIEVEVRYYDRTARITCDVMDRKDSIDLLLGFPDWQKLGFWVGGLVIYRPQAVELEEITVNKEMFEDDSDDELDPRIKAALERNAKLDPHSVCKHPLAILDLPTTSEPELYSRRNYVKPGDFAAVDETLQSWIDDGIVEIAPEDTKCILPLLTVPKHDDQGRKSGTRVCIDMREFNKLLDPDDYPLPTVAEVISVAGQYSGPNSRRTKIDCSAAYHRFTLKDKLIAFVWRGTTYRFTRAMFGVKTMTAKFQRVVDSIFRDLSWLTPYIDDFSFGADDKEECVLRSVTVVDRCTDNGLMIKPPKCYFCKKIIPLLGHLLSCTGVSMAPHKVEAISKWPLPLTGKAIMRFLGLANHYRNFIKNFATITQPLDVLRNAKTIDWTKGKEEAKQAFEEIKKEMIKEVTLAYTNPGKTVLIGTDASEKGIGAWRGHAKDDIPIENLREPDIEICEFASKALPESAQHGSATYRELLAIIFALKKFEKHLLGTKFILFTDHKALVYLFNKKQTSPLALRWIDYLANFDFEIIHWKGQENTIADALSRMDMNNIILNAATTNQDYPVKDSVLNEAEQIKLIEKQHRMGHLGISEVYKQLRLQGYFWDKMKQSIQEVLMKCTACQQETVQKHGFHPLKSINVLLPWDHIAIDTVVEVPVSTEGHDTLLVVVDMATRFVILKALKGKNANQIASALLETFGTFGFPTIVQSDNGTEFVNEIVRQLTKQVGIDHRTISAYHPRANGAQQRH